MRGRVQARAKIRIDQLYFGLRDQSFNREPKAVGVLDKMESGSALEIPLIDF